MSIEILRIFMFIFESEYTYHRGAVKVERSPRMREIGVRFPVATDLSRKTGNDSSIVKRSATGVSVTGPRR